MLKKLILPFAILPMLIACGGSKDADPATNSTDGKPCGYEVIGDQNDMALTCQSASHSYSTNSDVQKCIDTAESFLAKYPNVNCTATVDNPSSVTDDEITISAESIKATIEKLKAAISG